MNDTIKQLLVALLLVVAGLISPSNGVDDKMNRDLLPMLTQTGIIMMSGIVIFVIYKRFFVQKEINKN